MTRRVFLARPTYSTFEPESEVTAHNAIREGSDTKVLQSNGGEVRSLLCDNFNHFWAQAWNRNLDENLELTHFAMLHADVCSMMIGWLDLLIDEMDRKDVTLMATVVAIKNRSGDTSTRVGNRKTREMSPPLTVQELRQREKDFGKTFTIEDLYPLSFEDHFLCINTGMWVCRFGEWMKKVVFNMRHWMTEHNNRLTPHVIPEDYYLSMDLDRLGLRVGATRAVSVHHIGKEFFGNQ
jgi:hypothetical protein